MGESRRPQPESTDRASTASAGEAQQRSERESLVPEQPNYDAREERISEERKPPGPPLAEGARPPQALDSGEDEPPVDPE